MHSIAIKIAVRSVEYNTKATFDILTSLFLVDESSIEKFENEIC